jgi:hypothetical protein
MPYTNLHAVQSARAVALSDAVIMVSRGRPEQSTPEATENQGRDSYNV